MATTQLIVGLGNPGSKYAATRHNIGFRVLDLLAHNRESKFVEISKYKAEVSEIEGQNGNKITLIKPTTFMNLSGEAVSLLAKFYKIDPLDIWVVQDDKELEIGRLRLKLGGGGSGGHNGIKSIESCLGSNDFPRLKIGVAPEAGNPLENADTRDLVLSKFTEHEESLILPSVIGGAVLALENMIAEGPEKAASLMGY